VAETFEQGTGASLIWGPRECSWQHLFIEVPLFVVISIVIIIIIIIIIGVEADEAVVAAFVDVIDY